MSRSRERQYRCATTKTETETAASARGWEEGSMTFAILSSSHRTKRMRNVPALAFREGS